MYVYGLCGCVYTYSHVYLYIYCLFSTQRGAFTAPRKVLRYLHTCLSGIYRLTHTFMNVYVCVYIYIYINICTHIYVYVMYTYKNICIYMQRQATCTSLRYICVFIYIHIYSSTHSAIYTYVYLHKYVCIWPVRICIYVYTCVFIYISSFQHTARGFYCAPQGAQVLTCLSGIYRLTHTFMNVYVCVYIYIYINICIHMFM